MWLLLLPPPTNHDQFQVGPNRTAATQTTGLLETKPSPPPTDAKLARKLYLEQTKHVNHPGASPTHPQRQHLQEGKVGSVEGKPCTAKNP